MHYPAAEGDPAYHVFFLNVVPEFPFISYLIGSPLYISRYFGKILLPFSAFQYVDKMEPSGLIISIP